MEQRARTTSSSTGRRALLGSPQLAELGTTSPHSSPGSGTTTRSPFQRLRPQQTLSRFHIPLTPFSISLSFANAPSRPLTAPIAHDTPLRPPFSPSMRSPKPSPVSWFNSPSRPSSRPTRPHAPSRTRIPGFYIHLYYSFVLFWRRTRLARTLLLSAGAILLFFHVLTTPPPPPKSNYDYQYSRIPILPVPLDANPSSLGARGPLEPHTYLPSGLVVVNPRGRHPIYELVERAQREWEEKNVRASRTLQEAVKEYQRRYGRWPPRGFDKWWAYVERHNVKLPDEYDQILADLAPFYAYSPRELRQLLADSPLSSPANNRTFTLSSSRFHFTMQIARAASHLARERADAALDLLTGDGESWMPDPGYAEADEWERSMEGIGLGSMELDLMGDAGSWDAVFSTEREPGVVVSESWQEERRRAIKSERFLRMTGRNAPAFDNDTPWPDACPSTSSIHSTRQEKQHKPKSFVYSPRLASSPCQNPSLVSHSPFLNRTSHADMRYNDPHSPLFSVCKSPQVHGDVLVPDGSHWVYSAPKEVAWKKKKESRLVWRGRPSEDLVIPGKAKAWTPQGHSTKRPALLDVSYRRTGLAAAPPTPKKQQLLLSSHPSEPVGEPVERHVSWLESELVDGPFPGWDVKPLQPPEPVEKESKKKKDDWKVLAKVVNGEVVYVNETEAAEVNAAAAAADAASRGVGLNRTASGDAGNATVTKVGVKDNSTAVYIPTEWDLLERNNQYKYVLDIDDHSCSASFRHLLATGALVLKATAFEEWNADRVQPWVHYVPVQLDLSDLYDVLTFFRGDVANDGDGEHDELAQEIASAGKDWASRYWRREDMTAYMYRLFLEYGRLMSDDRDKMNFYQQHF